MKYRTVVTAFHPAVPTMPCVCRYWMYRIHLMCDRTHREVTKPLKTPIKHTHTHRARGERTGRSVCVCVCVTWLQSKAFLMSQHGAAAHSLPPDLLLRSLAPTTVTRPITAGRCDGQPSTPRTLRAEGLSSEDECGVNEGLWCFDWLSELIFMARDEGRSNVASRFKKHKVEAAGLFIV